MSPSFIKTLLTTLLYSAVVVYAGPSWRRADFSDRSIDRHQLEERDCPNCPYAVQDMNQQLSFAKPYVRFELMDTANRKAPDVPIVFDITNCGDTQLDNNIVRAHERVDNIPGALRKCQAFVLQPQLQIPNNTYGIHTSDWLTGYGLVSQGGNSPTVSITTTDPMWQESQQYQLQCFTAPPNPNAKDSNGLRYFGKQCRIEIVGSGKCLAAVGYNTNKNAQSYDLGPVDCDSQYKDLQSTWNVENVACSFTQNNHDMSVDVDKIAPPPQC